MTAKILWWPVILLAAAPAFAQVVIPPSADPGAMQQRQIDEDRRRREDEREQRGPVVEPLKRPTQAEPAVQPGQESIRFFVREIRFSDSKILSAEELSALASEYQGRESSLAELQKLASRVNELYRKKGVVTAQAVIPPQDVSNGVIRVRLVEGRLGKIKINGNESTNESYIVDRLVLKPSDLMDIGGLETALVRFNRTNDVQLQAELKPGETFATTDLALVAKEPVRQELRLTLDTLGATATGKERAGLAYQNRSLLGFRDDLGFSYTQSLGLDSVSGIYAFPVNTWGGRLNLGYYKDKTAIKNGALASLRITGESVAQIVSFRQPAFVDSSMQVDVVVGGKTRRTTNWIDSVLLTRTDSSDNNLGVEAQIFGQQSHWFASYVRSFGHFETTDRQSFVIDRASLRHSRDLGHGFSFRGNLTWQATSKVLLPSSEQFFIGGDSSVRGYPVGVFAGDTGQLINLELHHPLVPASAATNNVGATGFFFVDYGRVKPFRAPNSTLSKNEDLTGVGWGVHANLGKHAYSRLVFGYGLDRPPNQPGSYEVTFQLIATAF